MIPDSTHTDQISPSAFLAAAPYARPPLANLPQRCQNTVLTPLRPRIKSTFALPTLKWITNTQLLQSTVQQHSNKHLQVVQETKQPGKGHPTALERHVAIAGPPRPTTNNTRHTLRTNNRLPLRPILTLPFPATMNSAKHARGRAL